MISVECVGQLSDLFGTRIGAVPRAYLTLRFDGRPALLFPSELSEWTSEAQTRVQRWTRAGDSASPPQKTIKGTARGTETPLSRRSPGANTPDISERSAKNRNPRNLPAAPCPQLWRVHQTGSPVSAARARPPRGRGPAHREKGTTGGTAKRSNFSETNKSTRWRFSHPLTAREFLASFNTCLAA